jgi:hypothetical protein
MSGLIRKREVIRYTITVIRCFGWRVYLHCLIARSGATFLSILRSCGRI